MWLHGTCNTKYSRAHLNCITRLITSLTGLSSTRKGEITDNKYKRKLSMLVYHQLIITIAYFCLSSVEVETLGCCWPNLGILDGEVGWERGLRRGVIGELWGEEVTGMRDLDDDGVVWKSSCRLSSSRSCILSSELSETKGVFSMEEAPVPVALS